MLCVELASTRVTDCAAQTWSWCLAAASNSCCDTQEVAQCLVRFGSCHRNCTVVVVVFAAAAVVQCIA
eukprot:4230836-Amphidinium_carterae.1